MRTKPSSTLVTPLPDEKRRYRTGNAVSFFIPLFSGLFPYIPLLSRFPCNLFLKPAHLCERGGGHGLFHPLPRPSSRQGRGAMKYIHPPKQSNKPLRGRLIFCRIGRPREGLFTLPTHRPPTMSCQFSKVPTSSFSKRIHRDDSTYGVSTANRAKAGQGSARNACGDKFYRCHAHSSQDWPRL